jgi:hypothetical protein
MNRLFGQLLRGGLRHAEVDDLRERPPAHVGHQDVGWLDVPVDHGLLVRVLHSLADSLEEFQPLLRIESVLVAVVRDRDAGDVLHHEVRVTEPGDAGVEDLGNVRVVHQRQRLTLGLESCEYLAGVHAGFDQLEGDGASDGRELLRRPDLAHAPGTDPFLKPVGAYAVERPGSWSLGRARSAHDHRLQELAHASVVPLEEVLDEIAERGIVAALLREEGAALTGRQIGGGLEDRLGSVQPLVAHARLLLGLSVLSRGELRVKQRSREAPVTLHRRLGDIQDLGRFLDREAGEIAQRDDIALPLVTLA